MKLQQRYYRLNAAPAESTFTIRELVGDKYT